MPPCGDDLPCPAGELCINFEDSPGVMIKFCDFRTRRSSHFSQCLCGVFLLL